ASLPMRDRKCDFKKGREEHKTRAMTRRIQTTRQGSAAGGSIIDPVLDELASKDRLRTHLLALGFRRFGVASGPPNLPDRRVVCASTTKQVVECQTRQGRVIHHVSDVVVSFQN